MGRPLEHPATLSLKGIPRAYRSPNLWTQISPLQSQALDLAKRPIEVLLNIVRERLERRDVDHLSLRLQGARDRLAQQPVNADQKCRQRLARSGRRGNQRRTPLQNGRPALLLRLG